MLGLRQAPYRDRMQFWCLLRMWRGLVLVSSRFHEDRPYRFASEWLHKPIDVPHGEPPRARAVHDPSGVHRALVSRTWPAALRPSRSDICTAGTGGAALPRVHGRRHPDRLCPWRSCWRWRQLTRAAGLRAQTTQRDGTITGVARDESGGVLPGVTVVATAAGAVGGLGRHIRRGPVLACRALPGSMSSRRSCPASRRSRRIRFPSDKAPRPRSTSRSGCRPMATRSSSQGAAPPRHCGPRRWR